MALTPSSHASAEPGHPQHFGVMIFCGILIIIAGLASLILPTITAFAATGVVGVLLIFASAFALVAAFRVRGARMALDIIYAILAVIVGALLIIDPLDGALTLAMVAGIVFVVRAVAAFVFATRINGNARRGILFVGGLVDLVLGLMFLWFSFAEPLEAIALVGVYVAASLVVWGIGLIVEANHLSRLTSGRIA